MSSKEKMNCAVVNPCRVAPLVFDKNMGGMVQLGKHTGAGMAERTRLPDSFLP